MIRVDYEVREPLDPGLEQRLKQALERQLRQADLVLISDYDKGVCTPGLLAHVIQTARKLGRRTLVDPVRRADYRKYHGCSAMTPNRLEAGLATRRTLRTTAEALSAAEQLLHELDMEAGIVTLDKDGMALAHGDGRRLVFPTRPRQVYDITGAGDMVLSVLGMALAAGADYDPAIRLANIAGGLEVERVGVAPITRQEILRDLHEASAFRSNGRIEFSTPSKVHTWTTLQTELDRCRQAGKRIAFTNGCFDLLHAGHVQYLQEAKAQADVLVVGLNSDASVRALKGPQRPINPASARAEVLAGLQAVDLVVIFDALTPLELIKQVRPDVLVKGADYARDTVLGADLVESYGGRVHLVALKPGFSTTNLVQQLAGSRKRVA